MNHIWCKQPFEPVMLLSSTSFFFLSSSAFSVSSMSFRMLCRKLKLQNIHHKIIHLTRWLQPVAQPLPFPISARFPSADYRSWHQFPNRHLELSQLWNKLWMTLSRYLFTIVWFNVSHLYRINVNTATAMDDLWSNFARHALVKDANDSGEKSLIRTRSEMKITQCK